MRTMLSALACVVLAIPWSYCVEPPESESHNNPLLQATPSEVWVLNHFDEITEAALPVGRDDEIWRQEPRVVWRFVARIEGGTSPEWFELTRNRTGLIAERRIAKDKSLWDQAVAVHREHPGTTSARVAAQLKTESYRHSPDTCPGLVEIGNQLTSVSLGAMRPFVVSGFSFRYRLDLSRGHWFEGQWGGSDRDEPDFNTAIVNWIVRLKLTLESCDGRNPAATGDE